MIAEVNALTDEAATLPAGITLSVPEVKTSANDAQTFKPYNPSEITGPTSPGLPYIEPPDKGCGTLGVIIMLVVLVVVTVATWGALTGLVAGGQLAFGSAVAAGAIAGAAGSAAGMAVGSAMGVASFNWRGVAAGAVTGAITGGLLSQFGSVAQAVNGTSQVAPNAAKAIGLAFANSGAGYVGQKLVGMDVSFSWRSIAAGAVANVVAAKITPRVLGKMKLETEFSNNLMAGMVGGVVSAAVRTAAGETLHGTDYWAIAADAFGNALGSSIARTSPRMATAPSEPEQPATGAVTEEGWSDSVSVSFAGNGDVARSNAIDVSQSNAAVNDNSTSVAGRGDITTLDAVTAVHTPETQEWADYWRSIWNQNTWNSIIGGQQVGPDPQVMSWSHPPQTYSAMGQFTSNLQVDNQANRPSYLKPLAEQLRPLDPSIAQYGSHGEMRAVEPTLMQRIYDRFGEYGKSPFASVGLGATLYRGMLHEVGQGIGAWQDAFDQGYGRNPFTGDQVSGVEASDARLMSVVNVAIGVMSGGTEPALVSTARGSIRTGTKEALETVVANSEALSNVGVKWGRGIQGQGMPWEDYLAAQLPNGSRLPPNFKTFDFYDLESGAAVSAKTLDTTTASRLADPRRIFNSLKGNIDSVVGFNKPYELSGYVLDPAVIASRELRVAVPSGTNSAQWQQITRAIEYGQSNGVTVIVTPVH